MMKLNLEVRPPLFKITQHCITKTHLALIPASNKQRKTPVVPVIPLCFCDGSSASFRAVCCLYHLLDSLNWGCCKTKASKKMSS